MWFHRLHAAVLALVLTLLVSCSQTPSVTSTSAAGSNGKDTPGQPVAGKTAFWEMYKSAHNWSKDLVPLALESKKVPGVKIEGGNAVMWSATFGSPTRREARTFSYSVVGHAPDIYKGVTVGKSIPWGGPTSDALPFSTSDYVVDSDAAFKTASERAAKWLSKHPDEEVSMALGNAARFQGPVWYLLWGNSKSGYAVYVSAKNGAVLK